MHRRIVGTRVGVPRVTSALVLVAAVIGACVPADEPATTEALAGVRGGDASGRGETVRVIDVSDGDTIRVAAAGGSERLRLIGMNAPETGECLAQEASDRLAELIRDAGGEVVLVRDVSDTDRFGRLLRYVESPDGRDFGGVLVAEGLALARRYPPDETRADRYQQLQAAARDAGIGLWSATADRRYWCNTGSAVWNNSGDTVFLRDPAGNNVITYPYSRDHPNAS